MAERNPKLETLEISLGKGYQDMIYKEILRWGEHKLRVRIKSDSYAFQSFARIERWNGERWYEVHHIHHSQMTTASGLIHQPKQVTKEDFAADRDLLIKRAGTILM